VSSFGISHSTQNTLSNPSILEKRRFSCPTLAAKGVRLIEQFPSSSSVVITEAMFTFS